MKSRYRDDLEIALNILEALSSNEEMLQSELVRTANLSAAPLMKYYIPKLQNMNCITLVEKEHNGYQPKGKRKCTYTYYILTQTGRELIQKLKPIYEQWRNDST